MQAFPHRYTVTVKGGASGAIDNSGLDLPELSVTAPPEFGGPTGHWSPETMLVAAVADCLVLTFRAMARASKLEWDALDCTATGTLDRNGGVLHFTGFDVDARLTVPEGTDPGKAESMLRKAEDICLVTSSLTGKVHLLVDVRTSGDRMVA